MYDPTFIKYPSAYNLNVEEIPPPPPHHPNRSIKILLLILLVLVLVIGASVTWLYLKYNQSIIRSTSQTLSTSYSATDLVKDFQAAHLKFLSLHYGNSINEWDAAYSVPVAFTSSATFSDITGCTGACTPGQVGLWVYATTEEANSAYQEMVNTTPINGGGYLGIPVATVHGRCLLLGSYPSSTYVKIMITKCT